MLTVTAGAISRITAFGDPGLVTAFGFLATGAEQDFTRQSNDLPGNSWCVRKVNSADCRRLFPLTMRFRQWLALCWNNRPGSGSHVARCRVPYLVKQRGSPC